MAYSQDRDRCLMALAQAGFTLEQARQLLRLGTTLHRLAEAQCNGDYPYDKGCECPVVGHSILTRWVPPADEYIICSECEQDVRKVVCRKGRCPDCRAQDRVRRIVAEGPMLPDSGCSCGNADTGTPGHDARRSAWQPYFQGDPRECVLHLYPAGASQNDMYCARPTEPRAIAIPGRY